MTVDVSADDLLRLKQAVESDDEMDTYDITEDWMGPLFFFPNQCLRQTSWSHPHKTSPLIVMIDHQNEVQEGIYKYFKTLTKNIIK